MEEAESLIREDDDDGGGGGEDDDDEDGDVEERTRDIAIGGGGYGNNANYVVTSNANGGLQSSSIMERGVVTTADTESAYTTDKFELPESTYTLLISEDIVSMPFIAGIIAWCMSLLCLVLVLLDELGNAEPWNPLGVPAGLQPEVRMAQYLGIIVGEI